MCVSACFFSEKAMITTGRRCQNVSRWCWFDFVLAAASLLCCSVCILGFDSLYPLTDGWIQGKVF